MPRELIAFRDGTIIHKYEYRPSNCIYCGNERYSASRNALAREHIIPEGLGGKLVLWQASCQQCEVMLNKPETFVQTQMLSLLRNQLGIRGKKKRKRPATIPTDFLFGSQVRQIDVPVYRYPLLLQVPRLPPPEIIHSPDGGRTPILLYYPIPFHHPDEPEQVRKFYGATGVRFKTGQVDIEPFVQMLSKIAHAFAVAELGAGSFKPLLLPIIRGEKFRSDYLVGSTNKIEFSKNRHSLRLYREAIKGDSFIVCELGLFRDLGFPEYIAYVGLENPDKSNFSVPPLLDDSVLWRHFERDLDENLTKNWPFGCSYLHPHPESKGPSIVMQFGSGPQSFIDAWSGGVFG